MPTLSTQQLQIVTLYDHMFKYTLFFFNVTLVLLVYLSHRKWNQAEIAASEWAASILTVVPGWLLTLVCLFWGMWKLWDFGLENLLNSPSGTYQGILIWASFVSSRKYHLCPLYWCRRSQPLWTWWLTCTLEDPKQIQPYSKSSFLEEISRSLMVWVMQRYFFSCRG